MATINIGNLTFTHKGDYDGSTAYAKNDVVYYASTGSAYIAKQATTGNLPTSTAHWNIFSAGSGGIWNAGLSLGSAGQAVKVNAAGNALEFGTISTTNQMERLYHADVSGSPSVIDIQIGDCSNYESIMIYTSNLCQTDSGEDVYVGILITSSYTYKTGSSNYHYVGDTGGAEIASSSNFGMRIQGGGNHASDARYNSCWTWGGMKSGEYASGWGHASYQNSSNQRRGCQGFGMANFTDTVYGFRIRTQTPSVWRNQGSVTVIGVRKT